MIGVGEGSKTPYPWDSVAEFQPDTSQQVIRGSSQLTGKKGIQGGRPHPSHILTCRSSHSQSQKRHNLSKGCAPMLRRGQHYL